MSPTWTPRYWQPIISTPAECILPFDKSPNPPIDSDLVREGNPLEANIVFKCSNAHARGIISLQKQFFPDQLVIR